MSLPATNKRGRYAHIDALRAVAVTLVVIAHVGLGHIVPGGAGVTIFFTISGFIITTLLLTEWRRFGKFDIRGFYTRRAIKIVPPMVIAVVVPTFIFAITGGAINWSAFMGQMFFYYNWIISRRGDSGVFPGTSVVWSLSIEEQFYLLFALIWLWLARGRRAVTWLAITALASIVMSATLRLLIAEPGDKAIADRIYYGSGTRAESLAWGILAAVALFKWRQTTPHRGWIQRFNNSDWALAAAIAIFLCSLVIRDDWFRQTFRYSLQGIAVCMVLLYGFSSKDTITRRAFSKVCGLRVIQVIGLASYSIYLTHNSVVAYTIGHTSWLPQPLAMTFVGALAVAVGILLYYVVEVPSRSAYERFRRRKRSGQHSFVEPT